VTVAHLRVRHLTRANTAVLVTALALTLAALFSFVTTTLVEEPATMTTLIALLALAVGLDAVWKRVLAGRRTSRVSQHHTSG